MTQLWKLFNPDERRRLAKFLLVGASGTVIDLALLSILVTNFGLSAVAANTLSFGAGVINNYLLNRFWTFPDARRKSVLTQFAQFAAINTIGMIVSDVIIAITEQALHGWLGANAYLPAKLIAIGLVFFWNFFANRLWTYNDAGREITPRNPLPTMKRKPLRSKGTVHHDYDNTTAHA